jgi:glycosyltransferase involved in cell wall biosynthesis
MGFDISVIVPSYNRADLIPQTVHSILNQSHPPAEVIVVDDGSTDNTETVLQQFGSAIKYLRIQNAGQARARNIGVEASTSEWIAFCDSDDLWQPDKLSGQVRLFAQAPDVEYSFTNFRIVQNEQWSQETKFDFLPAGYWDLPKRDIECGLFVVDAPLFKRLLTYQPIFPSTIMMKRTFFEAVGRWEDSLGRAVGEDFEFTLRCAYRSPVGVVAAPVVGIRKHTTNFSGDALRIMMGDIEILRYVLKKHPWAENYADIIEEQITRRSAGAAEGSFEVGDFKTMRRLLQYVPFFQRSLKLHAKSIIASCPAGLGSFLQKSTLAFSNEIRNRFQRRPDTIKREQGW